MNNLLKLLKNNQDRGVRAEVKVEDKEATIWIYDLIGYDFWTDGGIVAADFVKEIAELKVDTIHLRINSPGGDVFDARAMKTALDQHPANVIAHIDGYAASAASVVALAGDEIEIAEGGFFMIHKAWGLAIGNSEDMIDMAKMLEKVDGSLVTDYQKKSGQKQDQIEEWMRAETWFTAAEALEAGFVDRIYKGEKVENRFDLSAFDNAPEALKAEQEKFTGEIEIYLSDTPELEGIKITKDKITAGEITISGTTTFTETEEGGDENLSEAAREKRERRLALIKRGI